MAGDQDIAGDRDLATGRGGSDLRLMHLLLQFARTLASDYNAQACLEEMLPAAVELLGVDGAGIMLEDDDGDLRFLAASDDTVRTIEELQIELEEGPCLLAFVTGTKILADDLSDDARFPTFGPRAIERGLRAVHSFPMAVNDIRMGALNLYRSQAGPLSEDAQDLGGLFADMASTYLLSTRRIDQASEQVLGIRHALEKNGIIEQAKGALIYSWGLTQQAAFDLLRMYARSNRISVLSVSEGFIAGTITAAHLGLERHTADDLDGQRDGDDGSARDGSARDGSARDGSARGHRLDSR